jgi:hypothetical protein
VCSLPTYHRKNYWDIHPQRLLQRALVDNGLA